MEAKSEVDINQLTQKYIDNVMAQQCIQFNKKLLEKLNENALNRAFQLDKSRT